MPLRHSLFRLQFNAPSVRAASPRCASLHRIRGALSFFTDGARCRLCYSTKPQTRFSRVVDCPEEQQFTMSFVSAVTAQAPDPMPMPPTTAPAAEGSGKATAEVNTTPVEQAAGATCAATASDVELLDLLACLTGASRDDAATLDARKQLDLPPSQPAPPAAAPPGQEKNVPIPLELLPPPRHYMPRVPLLSRPRAEPLYGPDASSATSPMVAAYASLFGANFVNPFNGRLGSVTSPVAQLLFRLGFYRSPQNPLHIEWNPTEYVTALQGILASQQKTFERARLKQARQREGMLRRQRAAATAAAKAKMKAQREARRRRKKGKNSPFLETPVVAEDTAAVSRTAVAIAKVPETATAALVPLPPAEAVAQARETLLRPLRRRGPAHWMFRVADYMERQDVFTFLNKEIARLYQELSTAYVPPKLDTAIDGGVTEMELTRDQRQVLQLAMHGYSIFVGGSAGTGKTVLLKAIFRELTRMGLRVAMTATTGVAAVQLGGCTFHHAFNAPVDAGQHRWDANALRAVDVVIVDEVSLLDAGMFEAFDMEARLARMQHVPFGGLQVIACGDFLQLSRDDAMPAYESAAFRYLVAVRLVTPMRHAAGDPLLELLEQLRRGEFNAPQFAALHRPIPADTTHITYIFPRRREAQLLNEAKLGELTSQEMTLTPQRGPLQLYGLFTKSAVLEMKRDANQMQRPLPRREQLLHMVQEEVRRVVGGGGSTFTIADHEMVVMPVRSDSPLSGRFVLRLRLRESSKVADAPSDVTAVIGDPAGEKLEAGPSAEAGVFPPPLLDAPAVLGLGTATAMAHRSAFDVRPRRAPSASSPLTDAQWECVAAAVAERIGGRLVSMLSAEPTSMVPLSVSMTLADMTSADIAHSLSPLRLKLGCRVMINRNLSRTVSNGSVGIVEAFAPPDAALFPRTTDRVCRSAFKRMSYSKLFERLPIVRLLSGEVVQVPPVPLLVGGTAQSYYYGHEVLTIPLQLGYAFTVHKVQGLTLQGTVVLDCEKFFDCPHLIYVACSRVRRLDQLVVRHVEPRMIIVRRSALEFSERLLEARALNTTAIEENYTRAAWAMRSSQRVLTISD